MADLSREQLIEIVSIATNATKKENSGLVQDIKLELSKLSERFTELARHIAVIDERHQHNTDKIIGIEKHLEKLNSKVATQEKINSDTALVLERCVEGLKCIPDISAKVDEISLWKSWVTGLGIAFMVLGGVVVSLIVYIYQTEKNLDKTVQVGLETALPKYEISQ